MEKLFLSKIRQKETPLIPVWIGGVFCVLETGLTKNSVYLLSGLLAHLICVMDVNQLDCGDVVTQKTGYCLDIYTLSEETGGVCVPEIVYGVAGNVPVDQAVDVMWSAVMRQAAVYIEDALFHVLA